MNFWWWMQVGAQVVEGKVLDATGEIFGWHLEKGILDILTKRLERVGDETKVVEAVFPCSFDNGSWASYFQRMLFGACLGLFLSLLTALVVSPV